MTLKTDPFMNTIRTYENIYQEIQTRRDYKKYKASKEEFEQELISFFKKHPNLDKEDLRVIFSSNSSLKILKKVEEEWSKIKPNITTKDDYVDVVNEETLPKTLKTTKKNLEQNERFFKIDDIYKQLKVTEKKLKLQLQEKIETSSFKIIRNKLKKERVSAEIRTKVSHWHSQSKKNHRSL